MVFRNLRILKFEQKLKISCIYHYENKNQRGKREKEEAESKRGGEQ